MILPTKYISTKDSLISIGALLLKHMERPITVTSLWEKIRQSPEIGNFERFTLTLDLLFIIGAIEFREDLLQRSAA